jgi:hypothetical protein
MMSLRVIAVGVAIAAIATVEVGCASKHFPESNLEIPAQQLAVLGTPAPHDGRARFREVFCALWDAEPRDPGDDVTCEELLHRLGDEPGPEGKPLPPHDTRLRVLIVTGAMGECVQDIGTPFDQAIERLAPLGYRIDTVVVGGLSSSTYNAKMIAEAVEAVELAPDDRLVLLGYSKGTTDILHFLVGYPELAARVHAAVSVAGAVNGSPVADRFSGVYGSLLAKPSALFCEGRDLGMVESLRRVTHLSWLAAHPLPTHVQTFSVAAFTDRPHIARLLRVTYDMLADVDPRNDGQLLFTDQIVPGSTLLGYVNANHSAVSMALEERRSFWMSHPHRKRAYPRALLFESIVRFVGESLAAESD